MAFVWVDMIVKNFMDHKSLLAQQAQKLAAAEVNINSSFGCFPQKAFTRTEWNKSIE